MEQEGPALKFFGHRIAVRLNKVMGKHFLKDSMDTNEICY